MSDFVASVADPAPLAPWRSPLARSLQRNRSRPHSRYFQLATVQPHGRPANRTVVFRGFWPNHNLLMFVTDQRSQKVKDIAACPWAEACWYFTQTREQFRLAGTITLVNATVLEQALHQARQRSWEALSESGRQSFYWPNPGQLRSLTDEDWPTEHLPSPEPPPNFCLGLLNPNHVDHLELRGEPQNRTRYTLLADGQWQTTAIHP
jgi:pyridoxamine 5'-phosphate oxidase